MEPIRTGYIHVEPKAGDYIHGDNRLGTVALVPDGQWDAFLPPTENQASNDFETYACVSEATIHCVETLAIQQYQNSMRRSVRFLATNSGTGAKMGNDPQSVSECLRTQGTTYETDYPFSAPDFNTFYQTLTSALKSLAIGEFAEFAYGHSWVNTDQQSLMNALPFSPLSAAGFAWVQDPNTGYYISPAGTEPCHDFVIYGYEANNYWKVFDSYPDETGSYEKKLAWDFNFTGVKRHTIQRQVASTPTANAWWQTFLDWLNKSLGIGDYSAERTLGAARSPKWAEVRNAFIKTHPTCAICGGKKDLNVHHKKPFHLHPELELDPNNLITLCNHSVHHLWFGHLGNFKSVNVDIDADAKEWSGKINSRP